jgi:hypothetical protein
MVVSAIILLRAPAFAFLVVRLVVVEVVVVEVVVVVLLHLLPLLES